MTVESPPFPRALTWLFPELHPVAHQLQALASLHPDAGTLLIEARDGEWTVVGQPPLDVDHAARIAFMNRRSPAVQWLLPLRPGPLLDEPLRALVDAIAPDPDLFRQAGLVPFFVTAPPSGTDGGVVETRLPVLWFGLLPGDRYPVDIRAAWRGLMRSLYPDRFAMFLALENAALGGFDVAAQSANRPIPMTRQSRRAMIVVICGIDGSGKSSHCASLADVLRERGFKTRIHKIYRHGVFHDTVTDLTRLCAGDHHLHLWRVERAAKVFDSVKSFYSAVEPDLATHDVLVFDRYIYTHLAAAVGRSHADSCARQLLSVYPTPDKVFLLDLPVEEAERRIGARSKRTVDENSYMLGRYRHVLRDYAERYGFTVLDATRPFEENQRAIVNSVEGLLSEPLRGTPP